MGTLCGIAVTDNNDDEPLLLFTANKTTFLEMPSARLLVVLN